MAEHRFIIPGRLPSLNDYTKVNRGKRGYILANKMKQDLEEKIAWYAKSQLPGLRLTSKVEIEYLWVESNRRRDLDNIAYAKKHIQDALVKAEILADDGWTEVVGFSDRFAVDKGNPRVEVTIREIEGVSNESRE